jgi:hypothetical protein
MFGNRDDVQAFYFATIDTSSDRGSNNVRGKLFAVFERMRD